MNALAKMLAIADTVTERMIAEYPFAALDAGRNVERLTMLDPDAKSASGAFMAAQCERLRSVNPDGLSPAQRAFRLALLIDLERRAIGAASALHEFAITPYRGGDLHAEAQAAFAAHPLNSTEERQAYLALVRDYARLIGDIEAHTRRQAAHGIILPRAALPGAQATLASLNEQLPHVVHRAETASIDDAIAAILSQEIEPALAALNDYLNSDYAAIATDKAGYADYPGGNDFYQAQIALFADSDLSPAAIHQIGLEQLSVLRTKRETLAAELLPGVAFVEAEAQLRADPRARAATGEAIGDRYRSYMERIIPLMPQYFLHQPKAAWSIERASPSAEAGMSFGDYSRPNAADPVGRYRYNGSHPEERSLLGAAHLIYHEMMPGHHYQLSLQDEAELVHPLQKQLLSMATVEGWAVYASELAAEMGAMDSLDQYGHAVMQSFIAARMVVDTGLNALGWTLDQASNFLHEHTAESQRTIASEVIRYATDIPGQALAYGLGDKAIRAMRDKAQTALGSQFDIRHFHDRLLGQGGYPLPVLASLIDDWMQEQI